MDSGQINSSLSRLYADGARIVFWHDADREFEDTLPSLDLDDVSILRLDECPGLEAKVRLEREDPQGRYLLYAPFPEPSREKDWLLDVRLYSQSFSADRASIVLNELGLDRQSLRDHLADRAKFFASKDRLARLKRLTAPNDDEEDIDRKILAVLVRVDQPEFFDILIALFDGIPGTDIDAEPAASEYIEKYGLAEPFWSFVEQQFGYAEEAPSFKSLLIRLMVTDLAQSVRGELPASLKHLVLPSRLAANAVVCLSRWRDSSTRSGSFDALSAAAAEAIKLRDQLSQLEMDQLLDATTFLVVEQYIASSLRDRVIETVETIKPEAVNEVAALRQDGYWASNKRPGSIQAPREALHAVYDALVAAADLFGLRRQYDGALSHSTARAMFEAYASDLYRFDQLYRYFCESADFAESQGWDILKGLRDKVEDCYGNWYVAQLAVEWGKHVDPDLLKSWRIDGVANQQSFYRNHVKPILEEGDRRVFVIVSDAFRYEAARELTDHLNGKYRLKATLECLLGVLPSYTGLGMAALLPHGQLAYTDKGEVVVDGQSSAAPNRGSILESVGGVAVKAEAFQAMRKQQGRAFVKPHRLVYVYHNVVDAVGDSASTEDSTFDAVRKTINQIGEMVSHIVNNLNGNQILITADHGFLFQETPPSLTEKNRITDKPAGTVRFKKRYLLGQNLPEHDMAWHGSTAVTAGASGGMEFWVPKGANRFHFVGGSRFVHGGAMLQEIVVPVITVKQIKGEGISRTKTKQVGVSVLGGHIKITTNRHRFNLIQNEAVSERVKAITLSMAIYEGDQPVTNVETVTFDSTSADMNEWKKSVSLTLQRRQYSKKQPYQLILRNAETGVEELRQDVTIDVAFIDDF